MTIRERRMAAVSLGAGDNDMLLRRIRAHANFAEYVPIELFLMAGAPVWTIQIAGIALIGGRLLHAGAIYSRSGAPRIVGTATTLIVIGAASLAILTRAIV